MIFSENRFPLFRIMLQVPSYRKHIPRGLREIINAELLTKIKFERPADRPRSGGELGPRISNSFQGASTKIRRRKPSGGRYCRFAGLLGLHRRLDRLCRDRQPADAGAARIEDGVADGR